MQYGLALDRDAAAVGLFSRTVRKAPGVDAAHERAGDAAVDGAAFIRRELVLVEKNFRRDGVALSRIDQHEVGVEAERDLALALEREAAGSVGRERAGERHRADAALENGFVEHGVDAVLAGADAAPGLEGVGRALEIDRAGRVVGDEHLDFAGSEELPHHALMGAVADRGRALGFRAGLGCEEITSEALATPRFKLLQAVSPIVKNAAPDSGIRAGFFFNTTTNKAYPDLTFVQAAYQHRYIRWDQNGNSKGVYLPSEVETNRVQNARVIRNGFQYFISDALGSNDQLVDNRIHYVLVKDPSGSWSPAVISLIP